jgi:hypothetical protein
MKKTLKTIKETPTGQNKRSIDIKSLSNTKNKILIEKAKVGKLPGYHAVKEKGKKVYLRSNPDRRKKNNLDPKINR